MVKFAKKPLREILKEHGGKVVTTNALEMYRTEMETYAHAYAERAVMMAKHAGRKTVNEEDIKIVRE
jgi:histone H3/H4